MDFGTERSIVRTFRNSDVVKTVKQFRVRVKVRDAQEEMTEFIRFTSELAQYRADGTLTHDKEDASTKPAFIIEYPSQNIDGSYFIIKNYCIMC